MFRSAEHIFKGHTLSRGGTYGAAEHGIVGPEGRHWPPTGMIAMNRGLGSIMRALHRPEWAYEDYEKAYRHG